MEVKWRDALLAAMIPPGNVAGLPGMVAINTTAFWGRFGTAAPFLVRIGFRATVLVLTWMAFFLVGRPFHRLSPDAQDEFLTASAQSRWYGVRQLVNLLKLIACFAYFNNPAVHEAVREHH